MLHLALKTPQEDLGRLAYDVVHSTCKEMCAITPGYEEELAESILDLLYLPFLQKSSSRSVLTPNDLLNKEQVKAFIQQNLRDPD